MTHSSNGKIHGSRQNVRKTTTHTSFSALRFPRLKTYAGGSRA